MTPFDLGMLSVIALYIAVCLKVLESRGNV